MNKKTSLPYVFLIPPMLVLAVLSIVPTIAALNISFQDRELGGPTPEYIGFQNYIDLFSDRRFLNSVNVSVLWEFITVIGTMVTATLIAFFLFENTKGRTRNIISTLFIIPVLLPRVSAAFVWKFMYNPLIGVVNYPIKAMGGQPIEFLSDVTYALPAIAMVDIWQWSLFFSVILLKLLETLPKQPFEAALLDNVNKYELYFYIALPMLKAPLISLTFVKMVESLRSFDLIYVMTRGGPGIVTETLDMYAFSQGFVEAGRTSYAASMAVLMLIGTIIT
ncbi:MAG: sugar ABC transporter permease, partial [OCS116 cluster bacterium]|nr:sugar ABC transporter permease [OCS116 cluster bacterium]